MQRWNKFVMAVIVLILACGFFFRVNALQKFLNDPDEKKIVTESQTLFEGLVETGKLSFDDKTYQISLPPEDFVLQSLADKKNRIRFTKKEKKLINELYNSIVGEAALGQARLWNETHLFAAIRDNRFAYTKDTDNKWQAIDSVGDSISTNSLVPESFGYINEYLQPGFTDWITASSKDGNIVFTSGVEIDKNGGKHVKADKAGKNDLCIQIIGKPAEFLIDGVKQDPGIFKRRCSKKKENLKGNSDCSSAFTASVNLTPGPHKLRISVNQIPNSEKVISGIEIAMNEEDHLLWKKIPPQHQSGKYWLYASDNTLLTDEEGLGNRNHLVDDIGLTSLIGLSSSYFSSLSGLLSKNVPADESWKIFLSIDIAIQKAAFKALQDGIAEFSGIDDYKADRKAALVIINPDNGDILAVAGYPSILAGVNRWDHVSYDKVYPARSPLQVYAWQGTDKHNAPGSTFKVVTSLAALEASKPTSSKTSNLRKKLPEIIAGVKMDDFNDILGISPYSSDYGIPGVLKRIPNFNYVTIKNYYEKSLGSSASSQKISVNTTLGLREAIKDSINVWFARVSYFMNGDEIKNYQPGSGKIDSLFLLKMADKLGLTKTLDLSAPLEPSLKRYLPKSTLTGEPGLMDIAGENPSPLEFVLAQNSIGQGICISPLQMCRVASTVAAGKITTPRLLIKTEGVKMLPQEDFPSLDISDKLLKPLIEGMKAVPEVGTAKDTFKNFKPSCRVYGKTGTADIGKDRKNNEPFNTTWFIGWVETQDSSKWKKVAFACMVTHAYGKHRLGGDVPAGIVKSFLKEANL